MSIKLTEFARKLREDSTDAERLFWSRVRARRLCGLKFKRQEPVGPYIVDFVCAERSLIVELDGGQHADSDADRTRDAWLTSQGYWVLRFWNNDVLTNMDGVIETIMKYLTPSPQPSPIKGRELRELKEWSDGVSLKGYRGSPPQRHPRRKRAPADGLPTDILSPRVHIPFYKAPSCNRVRNR